MYSNLHKCWKITHVIIGPPNAGKTLFFEYCTKAPLEEEKAENKKKMIATQTSKFSNGYYNNSQRPQTTIGMDLGVRHIKVDEQPVTLNIWDTAGQDKYETITNQYFRKADIIWIVIDLTDEEGINSLKRYWIPRAFEYATKPHVQALLIGNKYDIIQRVLADENDEYDPELKQSYQQIIEPKIQRLISKYKLPYFQMSAKTGYNVIETFMKVTTAFMRSIAQKQEMEKTKSKSNSSIKSSSKSKSRRKNRRAYYNNEASMSRDDSISLDSRHFNFADD
eukprot:733930_1